MKKIFVQKILGPKNSAASKKFWDQRYFGQNDFGPKNCGLKSLAPQNWVQKGWSGQNLVSNS